MSRSLAQLTELVAEVGDTYARRNSIVPNGDWYLLKLQEELGEVVAEYLKTTGRARLKGADASSIRQALEDETADMLGMLLLFARANQIDLDAALERKWFQHLGRGPAV